MAERLVIGSRGSALALWQANWVKDRLAAAYPDLDVRVEIVQTKGDKILDVPLARIGGKGLFTKELEVAILAREIDLAVHSMKDLPTRLGEGLTIGAASAREDCRDAFVSADGTSIAALPAGSVVGTSSLRRRSQVLTLWPHLRTADIRGNVDTRLRKVRESGEYAGALMALAGLKRLGLESAATEILDADRFLPAVGQGVLGIEIREGDARVKELIEPVHDRAAWRCVRAERAFLNELEGGCQVPVGALAQIEGNKLVFSGFVGDLVGRRTYRASRRFPAGIDSEEAGRSVARELLEQGADEVLDEIFAQAREH